MKFLNRKDDDQNKKEIKIPIEADIEKNLSNIKEILKDCDDVIYREFKIGQEQNHKLSVIFTDGLANKDQVSNFVLESLMQQARLTKPNVDDNKFDLYDLAVKGNIAMTEINEIEDLQEAIDNILIGETVLLLDGYKKAVVIGTRGWPIRGISEPETETVIRGPRDGFVETGKVNTSLIRRRIRDPKLKLKYIQIGKRSKTDIAIMYIEDICNNELLKEVNDRLKSIDIDAIIDSSYIEQLIQDDWISPFPQIENTERPDAVSAALYEGRVAIVVDNTPFALLVPATLDIMLQSSEDYYDRWTVASFIRLIRYIALVLTLILPALYIAITSYHPGMLPTGLALYVAATRMGVPFPAFIEAFMMEITLELLRESGTRIAGPIGTTIGIVGGLVIGQASVEAGIVSPLMVIIVALTTISSFVLPNYSFSSAIRLARFFMMIVAAALGLYGIMLALIILGTHLADLKSFGTPYLSPYSSILDYRQDIEDSYVKYPLKLMKKRPVFLEVKNKVRMRENKKDNQRGEKNDS
ncbi:spore germination protein [Abyssisolibacter fermentans]|uniref:spore germination protein n=1 Tax=Abyssisolibacter fermentans TaxID=1766203 RepID=UPI0008378B7B|nr:spore germination protein [Abyssisolibacter fermentans]